tara:strand:+ start:3242 stop:3367 length:126 start_codon:yes stop_codon:yes gene_type:complete
MQEILLASRAFEATGIFEVVLFVILAASVVGTIILSKKGSL